MRAGGMGLLGVAWGECVDCFIDNIFMPVE